MTEVGFLFDSWRKMGFLAAPGADHRAAETVRAFAGKLDDLEPVASCGGLVALRPRKTDAKSIASPCKFYVCNPSTTGDVHPLGSPRIMDQAHLLLASDGGRCFDLLRHHKQLQIQTFTSGTQSAPWPIQRTAARAYASAVATNAGKLSLAFTALDSMLVCT